MNESIDDAELITRSLGGARLLMRSPLAAGSAQTRREWHSTEQPEKERAAVVGATAGQSASGAAFRSSLRLMAAPRFVLACWSASGRPRSTGTGGDAALGMAQGASETAGPKRGTPPVTRTLPRRSSAPVWGVIPHPGAWSDRCGLREGRQRQAPPARGWRA